MSSVDARPGEAESLLWTPLGSRARWILVAAALASAAVHIPVIAPHLRAAPYMGEEFIVLTAACLFIAMAALACDSFAVYGLGALTCGFAVVGYVATRLIAFPHMSDDLGNWFEPLGIVSVVAETIAIAAAVWGLRSATSPWRILDQ